ncbi:DUF6538 domain-containing protein [Devosia sp. A369]
MSDVAGNHNLIQIKGTWYYNRRVPQGLVAHFGKTLIRVSLSTKDKSQAKKLRTIKDVEWDAIFDAAEIQLASNIPSGTQFSAPSKERIVREYVDRQTAAMDKAVAISAPPDAETHREWINEADQTICILRDPANPELATWVTRTATNLLNDAKLPIPGEGEGYAQFAALVIRGLIEVEQRRIAKYSGDHSRTHFDHLFGPSHREELPFGELASQYLQQRIEEAKANRRGQKTIDKITAAVATICELVGRDTAVHEVDYDASRRVRTMIAGMPTNRFKVFGKLPVEKAIERAAKEGRRTLAAHTQGMYISTFKAIMELAAEKKLICHNPAGKLRALTQESTSAQDKRAPWSLDQVKTFFTSDFYRSCAPSTPSPYKLKDRDWRFWVPLICLFMGMRPNEVCQLLISDVRQTKAGVWYLDITDVGDGGTKTVKTPASRRKMALHPELIQIGLLQYHERRLAAKNGSRLFIGWKPDKYGNHATYPLKRFNEKFLPETMTLEENQSFYSLRHTFRDALRRADASPTILKALGAWEHGTSVSDNYGNQHDLGLQVDAIARVSYPGLDLAFLHQPDVLPT